MNSFLNRVLAPGLRRAGSGFASPRKAAPAIMPPIQAEPVIEEIVEAQSIAPAPSSREEGEARERSEIRSSQEAVPLPPSEERHEPPAGEHIRPPAIPSQPPPERPFHQPSPASASFLEEKISSHPLPSGIAPITEEKRLSTAEILSFETVEFNPAIHPTLRRFQPAGPAAGNKEPSVRSNPPPAREIVWETAPADPRIRSERATVRPEDPRIPLKQSETPPSAPAQPALPGDRSSQRAKKEEGPLGLFTKAQVAPIPPRGAILPRPGAKPQEEKGDLIIEQLEVRVVAEPERRPELPKARPRGPKGSGAWETAARYYLGKV